MNKGKEDKEEKRRAELARKAENARLLAEEEKSIPAKPKAGPKAGTKKAAKDVKPAGPGAIASGSGLDGETSDQAAGAVESYAATGIDNALDLLEVVTAKMDKASVGQQAAGIEKHPEVCFLTITALGDNADQTVYSEGSRYISSDLREFTTHHTPCTSTGSV